MNKRWSDFLFAAGVRVVCGGIIGVMLGVFFGWRIILRRAAHNDTHWTALWLLLWAAGGAGAAVLAIPYWQRPWHKSTRDSEDTAPRRADDSFRRVRPELYNRAAHPSLKQYHDFTVWLRQATVVDLQCARGDLAAAKAALVQFFTRGLKAGLRLEEMTEMLPSLLAGVGYADEEYNDVVAMLHDLNLEELGIKSDPPASQQGR